LVSDNLNDSFLVLALLELILSGIALYLCAKLGKVSFQQLRAMKQNTNSESNRTWWKKIFRH
jgi:hypothetical protein